MDDFGAIPTALGVNLPTNRVMVPDLYGSGLKTLMQDGNYIKLVLGTRDESRSKYLIALRATADYYGWTEELEPWALKSVGTQGGYTLGVDTGRRGGLQFAGGKRCRISRSPKTSGWPAGFTNAFRVSARCSLLDLAELAHFTKGDWYWMESIWGERISRERWEEMYQAGTSKAKGGLVSV